MEAEKGNAERPGPSLCLFYYASTSRVFVCFVVVFVCFVCCHLVGWVVGWIVCLVIHSVCLCSHSLSVEGGSFF